MSDPSGGLSVRVRQRLGVFTLDAAFEAAPRGVTALFGPSGAGKSAVLAAIGGATRPDGGRIAIDGAILFDSDSGVNLKPEQRGVGWVFQDGRLFPHLSVSGNLRYGLYRAGARPRRIGFDEVVTVLGVEPLLARRPRDLSGGERQRVALGRALLSQPRLLMLDEPLSALDHARKAEILPFLERLRDRFALPILYVTHSLAEVMRLADQLVVLEQGRVVAKGALSAVLERGDVPQLSRRADIGVTVETTLAEAGGAHALARLAGDGFELLTSPVAAAVGDRVRVAVLARDVLLATARPEGISARNLLPGLVEALTAREDGSVLVRVRIGSEQALLSAITEDAVRALTLAAGVEVWAIVKSVAVESGGGGLLGMLDE